ncbi:MAG: orotidine-5'-phosphate decarboxylase [Chloroflexota bacterium]|nr:orotidine-5'-phosphate decarboxylase [Chloroflexota bacterium]
MAGFRERLTEQQRRKQSCVVVGLDPRLDQLPAVFQGRSPGQAILAFNRAIIDGVADLCVAIKPQSAFYELHGAAGFDALQQTVAYARDRGLLTIVDAKRNDIGATAEAYARTFLHPDGPFNADAVTVNGYLGSDGVMPFLELAAEHGKAVFVLVKTSNRSSGELQDLLTDHGRVFEIMARLVDAWDCEAVVGGTWPDQASRARKLMPRATILVPGYGTQGATAEDVMANFRSDGSGAIVNSARGIIQADPWPEGPRTATEAMRLALNTALARRREQR